ncbi:MAG: tetratricopeptide repeat protein [Pseudomonadota bacterium]
MTAAPPSTVTSLLQQAVQLHQQGRYQAALALYRQVLELAPRQFDALHLSGVIARQLGQPERAVALIAEAIALDPAQAVAHCNLGAALQDAGRAAEALASYERAVALKPDYALALSNRGNALRKLGRLEHALASYDRALALRPAYPEAWCHHAIALQDLGRPAAALDSAERAIALRPAYAEAWCARGQALQGLRRFEEAVRSYDRAIALAPDRAEAYCWRGTAQQRLHQYEAALRSHARAVALRPGYALAHQYRANTLRALDRTDEAVAAYRMALEQGGDAAQIAYALAACGVGAAPHASPVDYVQGLFDQYASHFDQHLLQVLAYRTPALLDAAIRRALPCEGPARLDTLDLGCGTGLCGHYLRPYSRALSGVDLSPKMLEKAALSGLYDELACAELQQFLSGRADHYDLIVAGDVFVYLGDLAPVFAQVRQALRPGGSFCFSVEAEPEQEVCLRPSNRYAHSLAYLRRLAREVGFELVEAAAHEARQEHGLAILAYAVLLRSVKGEM